MIDAVDLFPVCELGVLGDLVFDLGQTGFLHGQSQQFASEFMERASKEETIAVMHVVALSLPRSCWHPDTARFHPRCMSDNYCTVTQYRCGTREYPGIASC